MLKKQRLAGVLCPLHCEELAVEANSGNDYEALTPSIIGSEESAVYTEALNFACSRPDIRNIAVTGAYGAGKSSVLLTWKECPDNDLRIMTVSLADFEMQSPFQPKADSEAKDGAGNPADEKKVAAEEKTIAYSILQQLLYKEKKSALPYSRIERISDIASFQVAAIAGQLLLVLSLTVAGLLCLFPDSVRNRLSLPDTLSQHLLDIPSVRLVGAGFLFFSALYLTVKKLHRIGLFDRRVSVDKIDMLKGAISTRPSTPSLLNIYIDEIVYFFEQTGYNVVIFEDLDRHNDGAIFIKLREINQIINNTRPDNKPVRFIYAVRDGLFSTSEARTKFFDFVIPVIPVMDSENAAEHFSNMFRKEELDKEGFSKCVSQLSLFIPDMRIMRNIANEFRIFQNLVNGSDDITRLLSMIAYKNICTEDYHGIDEKKGVLYSFVREFVSGTLTSEYLATKSEEIQCLENEIVQFQSDETNTREKIRKSILSDYISPAQREVVNFSIPGLGFMTLDDLAGDDEIFNKFLRVDSFKIHFAQRNFDIISFNKKSINEIKDSYEKRCDLLRLLSEENISEKQKKLSLINSHVQSLRYAGLHELTDAIGSAGFVGWVDKKLDTAGAASESYKSTVEQLEFIYFLLISGYVASDYMFYRSVFRPGSLSREDNEYIKAVSIGRHSGMTLAMPLSRVDNVTAKLDSLGLMMERRAWHPAVLLYLMECDDLKLRSILQVQAEDDEALAQLASQTFVNWSVPQRIHYLQQMAADEDKARGVVKRLSMMNDMKAACELLILLMCSPSLKWDNNTTDMQQWAKAILVNDGGFPDKIPEGCGQVFKDNLIQTELKISAINYCTSDQGKNIVRTIVEHQCWEYTEDNLKNIIQTLSDGANVSRESLQENPLSYIDALDVPALNDSVWDNINKFIIDYFIFSHAYDRIHELLNDNRVSAENIYSIVTSMQFIIEGVSKIKNRPLIFDEGISSPEGKNLYTLLLEQNRIRPDWCEFDYLLQQDDIADRTIAKWFNCNNTAFADKKITSGSPDLLSRLIQRIFNSGELSDASRKKILSNLHMMFLFLPENLTADQAALLIEYGRLAPIADVYEQLHAAFHAEHDKAALLMADLVLQRPALLENEPGFILINNAEFDHNMARLLLTSNAMPESIFISTLCWLWNYDEDLFTGPPFIASSMLTRLITFGGNEKMLYALLVQFLKAGDITNEAISRVIRSFSDPIYKAFISDRNYRRMDLTGDELELAGLLESAGFIQSLSPQKKEGRFRFIPHNSSSFRR